MLLDGLGWSHYSVFAPCIMTQTRILGRSGEGKKQKTIFFREKNKRTNFSFDTPQICSFVLLSESIRIIRINPD